MDPIQPVTKTNKNVGTISVVIGALVVGGFLIPFLFGAFGGSNSGKLKNTSNSNAISNSNTAINGNTSTATNLNGNANSNTSTNTNSNPNPLVACAPMTIVPSINAASVYITTPATGADHGTLRYRSTGATTWTTGQNAVHINTGALTTSIFWLNPASSYDVELTTLNASGSTLAINQCTTTTLADVPATSLIRSYAVSSSAPSGGDGSLTKPFTTVQAAINVAQAGDQITVQPGIYHELLTYPRSGKDGAYIKMIGQPGAEIYGSDPTVEIKGLPWVADSVRPSVYSASLAGTDFATISMTSIWRDANYFYQYDSLSGLQTGTGHASIPIAEGWFVDSATHKLYVRSTTGPGGHVWHIPGATSMANKITQQYIWIEGLTYRYFDFGFYLKSAAHTIIRKNTFQAKIGVQGDNSGGSPVAGNRIEFNSFTNAPIADWGYLAVKSTPMEAGAIALYQGQENIIRDNSIEQYHDGILTGDSRDTDVYRNSLRHLSDDGLELDGQGQNMRVWNNTVDDTLSALSLAGTTVGPTWVLYNRFTNFTARAFKIGGGVNGFDFIYHNTAWTSNANAAGTQQVTDDANTILFRNNIISTPASAIRWTAVLPGLNMDYDNVYSPSPTTPYYWNAIYLKLSDVCVAKRNECHGVDPDPKFVDPSNGVFGLASGSPDIDTALRLPGINDTFSGAGPDRGYLEVGPAAPVSDPRISGA